MLRFRIGEAVSCRSPQFFGAASYARLDKAGEVRRVGGDRPGRPGRLPGKPVQKRADWSACGIRDQGGQPVGTDFDAGATAADEERLPDG